MAKKISQLTQATQVKSDDVTVIVQDGETKKLPLNMMVTKQDIENKKVAGLAKLDEIEATYENDTYTPTITVKNKSSVKVGEGDGVDYSANVMDGHAKSAILTGNTLVNILPSVNDDRFLIKNSTTLERLEDGFLRINAPHKGRWEIATNTIPIKPSTKYLLITEVKNNTVDGLVTLANVSGFTTNSLTKVSVGFNGVLKQIITTKDVLSEYVFQGWLDSGSSGFVDIRNTLIEYQDGMENWDIPYFTGMQSVKLPVLKATGKNLLNPTLVERTYPSVATGENVPFNKIESTVGSHTSINMFNCEYGKTYTVSVISGNADRKQVFEIDKNNKVLTRASGKSTYTVTNPNTRYLYWYLGQDTTNIIPLDGVQIEEGSVATTYEPYKSNILTVNEDVTLRSNGNICDELNLLTGQLTQRIDEDGEVLSQEVVKTVDLMPSGTHPSTTPYCWKNGHIQLSSSGLLPNLEYNVVTSRAGQINQNATMIVKNDKRIFDLEILLAGGLVNTTYQALTLQNQVETGLSRVSLNSETEPDYLLYHMIMKLIEEKAYKLDDLTEKVSVFYLYEKLSDEQFETIYSALYPFVEDEIVEEPVVEELPEVVEDEVIM